MFNENQVLRTTATFSVVLSVFATIWRTDVGLGLLLGGLIATLALRLMIIDGTALLQKAKQGVDRKSAYGYTFKSFLKRCLLYSGALIVAILSAYLSFLGTLAGLLIPRLAILYHYFLGRTKRGT